MTEIKICGITRLEDALCAADCGADAVGFIFHPASPRYIAPERAREIIAQLPGEIAKVGVFVNRPAEEVERTVELCGLDLIQLHGDESPDYCRRFPPGRVIKAVFPRTPEELGRLRPTRSGPSWRTPGMRAATAERGSGPTGSSRPRLGETHPLILAGGLAAENIAEALAAVAPRAVDINSGCERAPGIKDHDRLRRIVGMVRGMDRAEALPDRTSYSPNR